MARKTNLDPKLQAILANIDDTDDTLLSEPVEDAADRLAILYQRLTNGREKELQPGMLVVWKPGLKNRRFPRYGEPAIVVKVLDPPILDHENESGCTYYREPLDLLLGILHKDGDFLVYHFDSRRFQPQEGMER
ncbi:MAG: hypothetical protein H6974_11490 [Gammaproteobacteria bacterium]|nr:hypothetical protein [Gammaproteobacteria bacterium]